MAICEIREFLHKIGYNSVDIRDIAKHFAPSKGFQGHRI